MLGQLAGRCHKARYWCLRRLRLMIRCLTIAFIIIFIFATYYCHFPDITATLIIGHYYATLLFIISFFFILTLLSLLMAISRHNSHYYYAALLRWCQPHYFRHYDITLIRFHAFHYCFHCFAGWYWYFHHAGHTFSCRLHMPLLAAAIDTIDIAITGWFSHWWLSPWFHCWCFSHMASYASFLMLMSLLMPCFSLPYWYWCWLRHCHWPLILPPCQLLPLINIPLTLFAIIVLFFFAIIILIDISYW